MHYLDNAATTAPFSVVVDTVAEVLATHFANPSSLYAPGMEAEKVIETARGTLAKALGCAAKQVYFTASGTEANNIAIQGIARARKNRGNHFVATGYEHPGVRKVLLALAEREGFEVTMVPPAETGEVDIADILAEVRDDTILVCAMQVNNETGAVLDVESLARRVKEINPLVAVHVDAVQGFCKLPLAAEKTQIDSIAVAGHKIHAPKGIGALYLRKGLAIQTPLLGGGQESGIRPGTENTAYIAGFAKAVELMQTNAQRDAQTIHTLRNRLLQGLAGLPNLFINSPSQSYPGIVNISLPGIRSETMLHFLEQRGVYVSSGSACSKGQASHTLTAMRLSAERIDSSLRISFDGQNTEEDIDTLLLGLTDGIEAIARTSQKNSGRRPAR